jgi:anti-sigma factor RsiW
MTTCQDLEPLFTPYVDGEATAEQRAAIEAHLAACPSCRACAAAEAQARQLVKARRDQLVTPAPARLHQKCAEMAQPPAREPATPAAPPFWRRRWALSLAATAALVVVAVFVYGTFFGQGTALAAQLVNDHIRCTGIVGNRPPSDMKAQEASWSQRLGWSVDIPTFAASDDLQFVQLRRCLHDRNVTMAHILYRRQGRLLSLFVMPEPEPDHDELTIKGQRTVIWKQGGRTYAVVGANSSAELMELADRFSRMLPAQAAAR